MSSKINKLKYELYEWRKDLNFSRFVRFGFLNVVKYLINSFRNVDYEIENLPPEDILIKVYYVSKCIWFAIT